MFNKLTKFKKRIQLNKKRKQCNHEWKVFQSGWKQCKHCGKIEGK